MKEREKKVRENFEGLWRLRKKGSGHPKFDKQGRPLFLYALENSEACARRVSERVVVTKLASPSSCCLACELSVFAFDWPKFGHRNVISRARSQRVCPYNQEERWSRCCLLPRHRHLFLPVLAWSLNLLSFQVNKA